MNPKNPIFLLFSFFSSSRKKPRPREAFCVSGKIKKCQAQGTAGTLLEQVGYDRFFFFQFGFGQFDFLAGKIAKG